MTAVPHVKQRATSALGGAWGRPLRVFGRQVHPLLREGSDWTAGAKPSRSGLDEDTAGFVAT